MRRSTQRRRRWSVGIATLALVFGGSLLSVGSAAAAAAPNMVLEWNLNAVLALSNPLTGTPPGSGQTPPVASIHLAMVQGAVYDAVNAIDRGHRPYLRGLPSAPRNASKRAAAATAAHHVLVGIVPALPAAVVTNLNTLYATSLGQIPNGKPKTAGIAIGAATAAAMLKARANDGRYVPHAFVIGTHVGEWRPELPAFVSDPFAWVAKVRPFTLTRNSQFRTAGPDALSSADYARDYNEVKALGGVTSSRTAAQTDLARFYSTNPLPMLNRTLRDAAVQEKLSLTQTSRLLALSSFSGADALINCWDDKEHWSFWRPITAIHQAADDNNPATAPQADWAPLLPTPPYPDQPSGYNCYAAALMYTADHFFRGDKVTVSLTSPALLVTQPTRTYARFTAVLKDTIDARIFLGIHFRQPDVAGARLGKRVANWVEGHFLQRVR